jgi:predicted nucleic-acid-binding Zn-ribbon protein
LDWREVKNMLNSRGADGPCLACGSTNWNAPGKLIALIAASDDGVANINPSSGAVEAKEVVSITCADCGFVRLHDAKVLFR